MAIKVEDYGHSPAHYAVALRDHTRLSRLIAALPRLRDPIDILTESESLLEEKIAEQISSFLDRRDVPNRETPLHLAVRLNDVISARLLASAGADLTLQNAAGWSPLQEATCNGKTEMAGLLLRHHQRSAWAKWCRRLPRLLAVLRRMRDFYMEITFHFESSLLPFVSRIAPSDTYRIWKRDGNLRADMTLAGFDGLKIQRSDQTFLFLGEGSDGVSPGSLLVLSHEDKQIVNAFENAGAPPTPAEEAAFRSQTSVFRPGMDVTRAELVGRMNWRRQERMEMVGSWKARVYEVQNVLFSFKTRKVVEDEFLHVSPLELDEDPDGFLVAENPDVGFSRRRHSSFEKGDFYGNGVGNNSRRNSNFELGIKEDKEWISIGRKSFREDDEKRTIPNPITSSSSSSSCSSKRVFSVPARKSVDISLSEKRRISVDGRSSDGKKWAWRDSGGGGGGGRNVNKESEYMKNLRPSIWLTEQFPLKTEELLPLLDILANKVKAVRRLRELLTTKLPSGTFPVKVAIPVVPTVRVVITFTKFEELQPSEQFYTPLSSPRHLQGIAEETEQCTWGSWLKGNGGGSMNRSTGHCEAMPAKNSQQQEDPFAIPGDYSWTSIDAKRQRMKEKKSKSRKSK